MAVGESFNRAKVTIGETVHKNTRALIIDGDGVLTDRSTRETLFTMEGPITITEASRAGATWTNGTETWIIARQGCSCNGG